MKRLVLFAGYDKDDLIDDYVVFYLKILSKCADIIYVADCQMSESQLDKIRPYTLKTMATRHEEYDFGSYKRAYFYAKENELLDKYDYLLLCNDSVYGPFFNLCPSDSVMMGGGHSIIEKMESQNTDVWGLFEHAQCEGIEKHLQSYFIAMTKPVFLNEEFENFISSVKKEKSKQDVIYNYEIALSILFRKLGFTMTSFLDSSIGTLHHIRPDVTSASPLLALKNGFPFLKIIALKLRQCSVKEINEIFTLIKPYYNIKYILNHLNRTLTNDEKKDFVHISTFNYTIKDKVRFYSEYLPSHKYRIVLFVFGKKIFSLSLHLSKKILTRDFEKLSEFLH